MTYLENIIRRILSALWDHLEYCSKAQALAFFYYVLVKLFKEKTNKKTKQWNLVWIFRLMRLYRKLLATNPGRKPYCISKWLQIPNIVQHCYFAAYQSTSMSLTASNCNPIFLQQCIFHYLYFNHDNCSTICCYLFTPCHKYFKCFHHYSGLLAPMYIHISVVFRWTYPIWLSYLEYYQPNCYSQQVITPPPPAPASPVE